MLNGTVGSGGFSRVCHYRDYHGNRFACKITPNIHRKVFMNEMEILKSFPPNIRFPTVYDHFETEKNSYMVMSLFRGSKIYNLEKYTDATLKSIARGITRCIALCEENEVIHLDIKPQNVMMSDASEMALTKLIDFGHSVRGTEVLVRNPVGTLQYMSPEHITYPYRVTSKSDIWAVGVIMYHLGTGFLPFDDDYSTRLMDKIRDETPDFDLIECPDLREFVRGLLEKDPASRPSATDILKNPFLEGDIWNRYEGILYPDERIESYKRPGSHFISIN